MERLYAGDGQIHTPNQGLDKAAWSMHGVDRPPVLASLLCDHKASSSSAPFPSLRLRFPVQITGCEASASRG